MAVCLDVYTIVQNFSFLFSLSHAVGATADEFYKRYPSDIALMQSLGVRHFRLSIAWPRILPKGSGSVNHAGVNYYVGLVNALQSAGIEPYVTLWAPAWKPCTALASQSCAR